MNGASDIEHERRREVAQQRRHGGAVGIRITSSFFSIVVHSSHDLSDARTWETTDEEQKDMSLLSLSMILYDVVKQTCVHHSCTIGLALVPSSK